MVGYHDRADLPRGTVTLLFTDIEGSTSAARALGPAYPQALARHRELVRAACEMHDGREVDTAGDGFFVVFSRAVDAVAAAAEAQRSLTAEAWPAGGALRARMGIHTGEPELGEEGYVGIDIHLASRICAAAHGGQVLLSRATRDLVGEEPVPGGGVRDLGEHRLKDFERPERLFQLDVPGLDGEHPPPRTRTAVSLLVPSNRLVGREAELAQLWALLERPDVHLVTLAGPGGTGKSRLAIELAWEAVERFADGVFLVRLATLSDPELVPSAIAAAVGVREPDDRTLMEAITEHLRDREALLVLDNMEHVLPAAPALGPLLAAAPSVRIVATSRIRLAVAGEHVVSVDPLPEHDATVLFAERAQAADHRFDPEASAEAVREICRRLDGLPLAIELAAARVALLPPAALLKRLDLALLSGGPADRPERQRTLRATIDWSYGLLTPSQRSLHTSLSVFAGGCSLDAIEATVDDGELLDDLGALVTGNLLHRADADDEPRFRMLEIVRRYALDALALDGRDQAQRERHAEWVAAFADQAEAALIGPDQAAWLERIESELPNVRAALDWSLLSGRADLALRIASSLLRFWRAHGYVDEARRWLDAALAQSNGVDPAWCVAALWAAGRLAMAQGDSTAAAPLLQEALSLYRTLGRRREEVFALSELGLATWYSGDLEGAEALCAEALEIARGLDDARAVSAACSQLAGVVSARGDHARARELHEEALDVRRRLGDPLLIANAANNLGFGALFEGDTRRAREALTEALTLARELGDTIHTAHALYGLGQAALLEEEYGEAAASLGEALQLFAGLEDDLDAADVVSGLAAAFAAAGRSTDAALLWGAADELRHGEATGISATIEARLRPSVVDALGPERFSEAARRGASLRLEELPAVALPEIVRQE
jgi:predicted ATPase/class 3 adenylate cyclase